MNSLPTPDKYSSTYQVDKVTKRRILFGSTWRKANGPLKCSMVLESYFWVVVHLYELTLYYGVVGAHLYEGRSIT